MHRALTTYFLSYCLRPQKKKKLRFFSPQFIALLFSTTTLSDLNPSQSSPSGRGWREGCSSCSFVPEENTLTFSKGIIRSISVNRANRNQRLRTNRRGVPGLFFNGEIEPMPASDGFRGKLAQGGLMELTSPPPSIAL